MNTIRYFLALFLIVSLPSLFLYWLLVHPFVNFWRGQGIGVTYTSLLTIITASMVGLFVELNVERSTISVEVQLLCVRVPMADSEKSRGLR